MIFVRALLLAAVTASSTQQYRIPLTNSTAMHSHNNATKAANSSLLFPHRLSLIPASHTTHSRTTQHSTALLPSLPTTTRYSSNHTGGTLPTQQLAQLLHTITTYTRPLHSVHGTATSFLIPTSYRQSINPSIDTAHTACLCTAPCRHSCPGSSATACTTHH